MEEEVGKTWQRGKFGGGAACAGKTRGGGGDGIPWGREAVCTRGAAGKELGHHGTGKGGELGKGLHVLAHNTMGKEWGELQIRQAC